MSASQEPLHGTLLAFLATCKPGAIRAGKTAVTLCGKWGLTTIALSLSYVDVTAPEEKL